VRNRGCGAAGIVSLSLPSALSAGSVWAFGGTSVAHWNGHVWARTSVRGLLPAKQLLNSPAVAAVYAQSANSVWAVGDGYRQDEGGPVVVLHYNGHRWSRVARSNVLGYPAAPQLAPDGHGGLWIPVGPTAGGTNAHLLHYAGGHLTSAVLPSGANRIDVLSVAGIPATTMALAAGFSYSGALGAGPATGVILQYGG